MHEHLLIKPFSLTEIPVMNYMEVMRDECSWCEDVTLQIKYLSRNFMHHDGNLNTKFYEIINLSGTVFQGLHQFTLFFL